MVKIQHWARAVISPPLVPEFPDFIHCLLPCQCAHTSLYLHCAMGDRTSSTRQIHHPYSFSSHIKRSSLNKLDLKRAARFFFSVCACGRKSSSYRTKGINPFARGELGAESFPALIPHRCHRLHPPRHSRSQFSPSCSMCPSPLPIFSWCPT